MQKIDDDDEHKGTECETEDSTGKIVCRKMVRAKSDVLTQITHTCHSRMVFFHCPRAKELVPASDLPM